MTAPQNLIASKMYRDERTVNTDVSSATPHRVIIGAVWVTRRAAVVVGGEIHLAICHFTAAVVVGQWDRRMFSVTNAT